MKKDKITNLILGTIILSTASFIGFQINKSRIMLRKLNIKTECQSNKYLDDTVLMKKEIIQENEKFIKYFSHKNSELNIISSQINKSNNYFKTFIKTKDKSYLNEFLSLNNSILNKIKNLKNCDLDEIKNNLDVIYLNEKFDLLEKSFVEYNEIFESINSNAQVLDNKIIDEINNKSLAITDLIYLDDDLTKKIVNTYKLYITSNNKCEINQKAVIAYNHDLLDMMIVMTGTDSIFNESLKQSPNSIRELKDINLNKFKTSINEMKTYSIFFKEDTYLYTELNKFVNDSIEYSNALDNYFNKLLEGENSNNLKADKNKLKELRSKLNNIYKIKLSIQEHYKIKN